jgi:hypothetical protein
MACDTESADRPALIDLPSWAGKRNTGGMPLTIPPEMEGAFRMWWSKNSYALDDGGCGDLFALVEALEAALPKA